jgi:hypothetical protein
MGESSRWTMIQLILPNRVLFQRFMKQYSSPASWRRRFSTAQWRYLPLFALPLWCERRIRLFSTFDDLKVITRRGRIGTSTPVFGLRPMRSI